MRCHLREQPDPEHCEAIGVLAGERPKRSSTFAAFRHRNYRLLWIGNLISNSGDWIDQVALNWLVISTTDSPVYLGLVNLARGLPLVFFALIGGAVADRMDRRRMMMMTQTLAMCCALALVAAVLTDNAPISILLILSTARGILIAFNTPARHSLISELVPHHDLGSAVALNSVMLNMSKVLGPLLAAMILSASGTAACFIANAVSFTAVLVLLAMMDMPPKPVREARRENLLASVSGGAVYLRRHTTLLLLVLVALVPTFLAQPYIQLLALFAHDVFDAGSSGLGIMVAVASCGSICGGLFAAWVQRDARKGTVMLGFMAGFGAFLVAFALAPNLAVALPLLFVAGFMHVAYNSSNNTILQMTVDDEYRGRVLSTLFMTRGLVSLGTATAATLAVAIGSRASMVVMAGAVVIFAAALWVKAPKLKNLRI
jgi:MFS family permease